MLSLGRFYDDVLGTYFMNRDDSASLANVVLFGGFPLREAGADRSRNFRPHTPRNCVLVRSVNGGKNALSSAARIGAAIHALPAVQRSHHLRLFRVEPARRGSGN